MAKGKRKRKGAELTLGATPRDLIPQRTASQTYATPATSTALPAVWAAVDMITNTVLQIPIRAAMGSDPYPLPEWLRKPERWNGGVATQSELVEALTVGQALHGAGYLWAEPIGSLAWRLVPIDPDRVTVELMLRGRARVRVYSLDGKRVELARRFTTRDSRAGIVPVPHRLLPGIAAGAGPIQAARYSMGAYLETENYGSEIYGDGVPAGILKTEQDITQTAADRYKRDWMASAGDPIRVIGSGLSFDALKLNPRDAAWLDARRFNGEEIARMYLIPAHKLNLAVSSGLSYSNPESLERDFLRGCIAGYVEPVERALSALLPDGRNADEAQSVDFDYRGLLRTTTAERYASYGAALAAGFLTVDEVRDLEGLPPMPESERPDSGLPATRSADAEPEPEPEDESENEPET